MKLSALPYLDRRRGINHGSTPTRRTNIEASERGEVVSLEELNQRLDAKHAEILERQKIVWLKKTSELRSLPLSLLKLICLSRDVMVPKNPDC